MAAVAAVAASGAAAAYYVYDRYAGRKHCYNVFRVRQHMMVNLVNRWDKLKTARASLQELEER